MRTIRYNKKANALVRGGDRATDYSARITTHRNAGGFFASVSHCADISLSSLRQALISASNNAAYNIESTSEIPLPATATFLLTETEWQQVCTKWSPISDICIELTDDHLLLTSVSLELNDDRWDLASLEATLNPYLLGAGATLVDGAEYGGGPFAGNAWRWRLRFHLPPRGRSVGDAYRLGSAIILIARAAEGGPLDAETAHNLVKGGRAQVLIGQPESSWLEVKTFGWDISTDAGKIELAQDIARFANSSVSALLIVGLGTKIAGGREVISGGPVLRFAPSEAARHHKALDQRLFPPVDGLEVDVVDYINGGQLLVFYIPAQVEESRPFLVQGTIVGTKTEGGFFSIVRRRGEHSIPVSAAAIHASIAAGRALLRRGEIPDKHKGNTP